MKHSFLVITTIITTIFSPQLVQSEDLNHVNQLLATKKCQKCNLNSTGLVMADLSNADLRGADLRNSNLSQANLSGADLTGADLTGASLYGANLSGTNLSEANLTGADLRYSYLYNANLLGVDLEQTYLQGAKGVPLNAGSAQQFYVWGLAEAQQGNYKSAIARYNTALSMDENYAAAYLARGLILYRLGNETSASQDGEIALKLFTEQENAAGEKAAEQFLQGIELLQQAEAKKKKAGGVDRFVGSIGSLLLQLLF
ncbi:MAG: tetratricopeptide repeat protein [Cyanobacteria bacterium J083]|nr:MAG: tetratricopeptide repeat protein [Cyanobacteria bacterium J083]